MRGKFEKFYVKINVRKVLFSLEPKKIFIRLMQSFNASHASHDIMILMLKLFPYINIILFLSINLYTNNFYHNKRTSSLNGKISAEKLIQCSKTHSSMHFITFIGRK